MSCRALYRPQLPTSQTDRQCFNPSHNLLLLCIFHPRIKVTHLQFTFTLFYFIFPLLMRLYNETLLRTFIVLELYTQAILIPCLQYIRGLRVWDQTAIWWRRMRVPYRDGWHTVRLRKIAKVKKEIFIIFWCRKENTNSR